MTNIFDWLWSHIPWVITTIIVVSMTLIGVKLEKYTNFNHQCEQTIARYGGLTPEAEKMLASYSGNGLNNLADGTSTQAFGSHSYVSNDMFVLSTDPDKYDKRGVLTMGAPNDNFNGNNEKANVFLLNQPNYQKNKKGHFVKQEVDGTTVFLYKPLSQSKPEDRYAFGYFGEKAGGDYVLVNGAYVKADSDKLTADQKAGKRYGWFDVNNKDVANFERNDKGNYVHVTDGNFDDYVWMPKKYVNDYGARYDFKGNYSKDKLGQSKNNAQTSHYIATLYQKDPDTGNVMVDERGNKVMARQIPSITTDNGGKIRYIIWLKLGFMGFHVYLPMYHTVYSQIRQASIQSD